MKSTTVFLRRCALLFLVCALTSGCWDRRELNDISIVTGIAIDKGKNTKYRMSIEIVNVANMNPKQGGNSAPSVVYSLEGNSLSELSRKMNFGVSRSLVYSHMRTVIISEDIARSGTMAFLEYMNRDREIRNDFNLLVARGSKARDVLTITYPFQKVATLKIHKQLQTLNEEWGGDPNIRMNHVIEAYRSEGRQPVMTLVEIHGSKSKPEQNVKSVTPTMVTPVGLAVFKQLKMVGMMNTEDSRSYLWTQDKLKTTSLTVPESGHTFFDVRILHSQTQIKTNYDGRRPRIQVLINMEGILEGLQSRMNLDEVDTFERLQNKVNRAVERKVLSTIRKAQTEYRSDIFGFGDVMYRQHPAQFKKVSKDWDDEFARADVEVHANMVIVRTGTVRNPFL
ncbi:MAG TPA: Ger(x)C family spore germination protein [Paenibacillus sp.]|uniref:Ger(x)C family spore germination protein n=1 Tax=Paenibacillus sp. TaxID=58172 RepID=UPI0028D36CC3|nr:Ger(x)C family spore germination protein [Paenibacillus sp.]HUC92186.1 Ger(x)C family spore germination protein [Paenibacillus sp.]